METLIYPLESKGVNPALYEPLYTPSVNAAPRKPLVVIPRALADFSGPVFGHDADIGCEFDLTVQRSGIPAGERIIVHGRVLDEDGRGVPNALIEIWQANASGRYAHDQDNSSAPLDPNFDGAGRLVTDSAGAYKFTTIKPAPYSPSSGARWWRPAHIHMSVFGHSFISRLVTQMYFPGDPLHIHDPIFQSVRKQEAAELLIGKLDLETSIPGVALAYRFDIVLRGRHATPLDND